MWAWFLKWLATFPSPWDAISALAAGGALTISLLERRDRQKADRPLIEAEAYHRDAQHVYARITISNQAAYDLITVSVEMMRPQSARIVWRTVSTPKGGYTFAWDEGAKRVSLRARIARAGTPPNEWHGVVFAHGDQAPLEFGVVLPDEFVREIVIRLAWRPALAGAREQRMTMAIPIPPSEATE